jgi:hypothetical protein
MGQIVAGDWDWARNAGGVKQFLWGTVFRWRGPDGNFSLSFERAIWGASPPKSPEKISMKKPASILFVFAFTFLVSPAWLKAEDGRTEPNPRLLSHAADKMNKPDDQVCLKTFAVFAAEMADSRRLIAQDEKTGHQSVGGLTEIFQRSLKQFNDINTIDAQENVRHLVDQIISEQQGLLVEWTNQPSGVMNRLGIIVGNKSTVEANDRAADSMVKHINTLSTLIAKLFTTFKNIHAADKMWFMRDDKKEIDRIFLSEDKILEAIVGKKGD